MVSEIRLEQGPLAVECVSATSAAGAGRPYDEERADLHVKLPVAFQSQSSFSPAAYDTIVESLLEDTHLDLYFS